MDYCAGSQCIIYTHSMSHIGVGRLGNIMPPCSGLWEVRNDRNVGLFTVLHISISQTKSMICDESIRKCQPCFSVVQDYNLVIYKMTMSLSINGPKLAHGSIVRCLLTADTEEKTDRLTQNISTYLNQ